ncbi:MAG: lamin tail domain-containing protein [Sporichthyaceae bacterium]
MGEFLRIGVAGLVAGLVWAVLPPAAWAADVTPVFDIVVNQIALPRGEQLRLFGTVDPGPGTSLTLRRRTAWGWTDLRTKTLPPDSTGSFRFRLPTATTGRRTYDVLASGPGLTTTPSGDRTVRVFEARIRSVHPGALEYVLVRNVGRVPVNLSGWRLSDASGTTLTLPKHAVRPGRAVRVYTGRGEDTTHRVYVGTRKRLWSRSDTATIVTRTGLRVARRQYTGGC